MKAITLVEALVTLVVVVLVLGLVIGLVGRGSFLFGRGAGHLSLVGDARVALDHLVGDVRAAVHVEEPRTIDGFERSGLVLFRPASADPATRRTRNDSDRDARDYPFVSDVADPAQHFDVRRVQYRREPDPGDRGAFRLVRTERAGFLTRRQAADGSFTHAFKDDARVRIGDRATATLAGHLTEVGIVPLVLTTRAGNAPTLEPPDPSAPKQGPVALVLVRLASRWPNATGPGTRLEVATKIWVDERMRALRFPGSFSSVDENVGY